MSGSPSTVTPDPGCGCWPRARIGSAPKARAHGSRWDPRGWSRSIPPTSWSRANRCRAPPRRFLGPAGARSRSRSRPWSVPPTDPVGGGRARTRDRSAARSFRVVRGLFRRCSRRRSRVRPRDRRRSRVGRHGGRACLGGRVRGGGFPHGARAICARHGSPSRCCQGCRVLDRVRGGRSGAPVSWASGRAGATCSRGGRVGVDGLIGAMPDTRERVQMSRST
jgi:hypothetical protein